MLIVSSVLCVVFSLLMDFGSTEDVYGKPSSDFSKHSMVKPKLQHGRTKREIKSTRDLTGSHHPEVTLTVSIDGEEHELDLRLNKALVPSGHSLSYQKDGQTRVHAPGKEELDLCQYSGRVRGRAGSWAAVSTCRGVRGVVYDGRRLRYIEPVDGNDDDINADHFLYSHEHLTKAFRCGNPDGPAHNSGYDQPLGKEEQSGDSRYKRHAATNTAATTPTVRTPSNANQRSRYVELVLVADYGEYLASGLSLRAVHRQMKDLANIINSVYAPLNIFISLVGVEVWTEYDKIIVDEMANNTLENFGKYRSSELVNTIPNDNAHLITRKRFFENILGRAYVGSMCSKEMSAGVASNHSSVVGLVAMTVAHEMGHNFGMEHDQKDCKCADDKCIMSPSSNDLIPERWSSCSLQSLSLSFEKGLDYCLRNEPKKLFSSPTCGNGFLEEGEQCDCGTAPGEYSPGDVTTDCGVCCKPDCTLRENATCGHGQCCDFSICRPKAIGTECRAAVRECDLPEYCNGTSPFCPPDVLKMDATPCGNEKAYCVRGSCRSHTDQCRLLWGVTGQRSKDVCYGYNVAGTLSGNCGYDRVTRRYLPCAEADVACGRLQCSRLTKEYCNFQAATTGANSVIYNGSVFPCHFAVIDMGTSDEDPGLVPDGAQCGPNKMCMQQRCLPVEQVREMVRRNGSVCPSDCSGHGVCNSNGNCHCERGYGPPLCALPGPGGSYDSGPIVDNSSLYWFMVAMYVIFLGLVPAIALGTLLIYCGRRHGLFWNKPDEHLYEKPPFPRFGSKFVLPNFNSFGNWLKNAKVTSSVNNTPKGQDTVPENTKHEEIEEQIYSDVGYNVCNGKTAANNTVAPAPPLPKNNRNIKKETTLNCKKKDIVMIENYSYHALIHKNQTNNLDIEVIEFKPNVNALRNKFESASEKKSNSMSPNFKDLNKELVELENNKIRPPINRPKPKLSPNPKVHPKMNVSAKPEVSSVRPKPSGNSKLGVSTKPDNTLSSKPDISPNLVASPNRGVSVSPKPSVGPKPSVSPKPNKLPRENNANNKYSPISTNNELLNQRSKLRKVSDTKNVNK